MKKYVFFLMITVSFGCKENLSGHWHLKDLENNEYSQVSLEVLENDDCYIFYSLSGKPIKGEHFPNKNSLYIPGDCGVFMFEYKFKNNKLYLTNALGTEFIGEKQNDDCNRFKDYATLLKIDYLKIKNKRELYQPKDTYKYGGLSKYINIDFSEESNSIRIEYFNRINSIDTIDSIIAHIESSVSDAEIPFINYVLTPDKNLKASDLKIVINKLNEGYKKKIFIQTLKVKPEKMNIFEFIKIDKIQLNSDNKLFYIIN